MLDLYGGVWLSRKDKPRGYWTAFAIEAAITLIFLVLGALILTP